MKKELDMQIIEKTMQNLEGNNMKPYFCNTSSEALELVKSLLKEGSTVATGGSMTLRETGVEELLRSGAYNFIDRAKATTPEETEEVFLSAFRVDTYLMSTNALTEEGVLYNVDGNSNRVAALLYGPKSVIIVCGYNKIVKNMDEAVYRMKTVAAPLNTKRLATGSYCESAGKCMSLLKDSPELCDGCKGAGRICCNFVVSAQQRKKDRIKVIIVGEELGF
ncbi:MAG: lactate utilization protein [Ruminococcus sp.]|nr:lactate utilization protein [Oscillospiraceae bacterium]MBR2724372.1 lactate utilization protein [Ruminococcus sp.]